MTLQLIGLSGYARSGKDTVADFLAKMHAFDKMAFADPMREALLRLNPNIDCDGYRVTLKQGVDAVGWEGLKPLSTELRPLLQRFGTEVCRYMFGEDIWVTTAMARIKPGQRVVFADVRFPNEADAIREAGGQVWRIERPGIDPVNAHHSERALDDYEFDLTIWNNSTLNELKEKVERAL